MIYKVRTRMNMYYKKNFSQKVCNFNQSCTLYDFSPEIISYECHHNIADELNRCFGYNKLASKDFCPNIMLNEAEIDDDDIITLSKNGFDLLPYIKIWENKKLITKEDSDLIKEIIMEELL